MDDPKIQMFEDIWALAFKRARRPAPGLRVGGEVVLPVLERAFGEVIDRFPELPERAELSAEVLDRARRGALAEVASRRREAGDPDLFRDGSDLHYPHNPDLDELQRRSPDGTFGSREWDRVPAVLQPLAFGVLGRKGVTNEDAEDVFVDTMALLVKGRASDGVAPVEQVTVFEELIPVFCTMLGHRAIDWARAKKADKNRPNLGVSFEALTEDPERPVQIADPATTGKDGVDGLSFEELYFQCRENLLPLEWQLIYDIYVSRAATRGELIEDPEVVTAIGATMADSKATRRRRLNDHLVRALGNLARGLEL